LSERVQILYRSEVVQKELFRRIVSGVYWPGMKLPPETSLAKHFGVSRPVLRQALENLRSSGLMVSRRGDGNYVGNFSADEFSQINIHKQIARCLKLYEFRLAIEPNIAALAAQHIDEDASALLEAALLRDEGNVDRLSLSAEDDYNFHFLLAKSTNNDHLLKTLLLVQDEINFNTFSIRSMMKNVSMDLSQRGVDYLHAIISEHRVIFDSVVRRDVEASRNAMRRHLEKGRNFLVEFNLEILKRTEEKEPRVQ